MREEYVREKNKQDEYLKWVFQPAISYVSEHVPPKLFFLIKSVDPTFLIRRDNLGHK